MDQSLLQTRGEGVQINCTYDIHKIFGCKNPKILWMSYVQGWPLIEEPIVWIGVKVSPHQTASLEGMEVAPPQYITGVKGLMHSG